MFDLRSEKSLCGCNLPAQDCVPLLHLISSARVAILDLVLGTILPNKRRLDHVSKTVVVHFLRNCVIITGFFFVGISTKRVTWCEEDSLPSFVAFFSIQNQSVLKDRLNAERTTLVENILSNCEESECTPSTQCQLIFHQSVLELLKSKPRFFGILAVLEPRLATCFMDVSKPICFTRLSFFWIKMTHQSCNHLEIAPARNPPLYDE